MGSLLTLYPTCTPWVLSGRDLQRSLEWPNLLLSPTHCPKVGPHSKSKGVCLSLPHCHLKQEPGSEEKKIHILGRETKVMF